MCAVRKIEYKSENQLHLTNNKYTIGMKFLQLHNIKATD